MKRYGASQGRRFGFSVAELMVAVGVLAVVAALLIGATGAVRNRLKPTREIQTLRQMGVVLHLYIAEHRGGLPQNQMPVAVKILAHYLGYTQKPTDWSNDSATPKNSVFLNGADETAIRRTFRSAYGNLDPLNALAINWSMGVNPADPPEEYDALPNVRTYPEIRRPREKLYMVPSWFIPSPAPHFSEATTSNPFRSAKNRADKGDFPALFVDGHVEMVNPTPEGMTLNEINYRWLRPKYE